MQFLTNSAQKVFSELSGHELLKEFTFVGGSAVAYHLRHRLSEDLDFFTWKDKLPEEINQLIRLLSKRSNIQIASQSSVYSDIFIDNVKVTFFANDWSPLRTERTLTEQNIFTADLKLLTAMKVNALSLRAKYRDYYDLYVINKTEFDINRIFEYAVEYIPGITKKIFAMQLTYTEDIDDEKIEHLMPKYKITLEEIQKHFMAELKTIVNG